MFRINAIKAQANRLEGEVTVAQPVSSTIVTTFLFIIVIAAILFLSLSSYDRKETVSGFLQPDSGLSRISAPRGGIISTIYVEDGAQVKKGDPLILLKAPNYLSGGGSLAERILDNLDEQMQLFNERKAQALIDSKFRMRELKQRIKFNDIQISDIDEQLRLLQKRLDINKERLLGMHSLEQRGLLAADEAQQQKGIVLNVRQQISELKISQQTFNAQREQLRGELARLPGGTEQELRLLESEITRLKQKQLEIAAGNEILITASGSGVITNLIVEVGQEVRSSDSLLTVLPENASLKAILLVPTRAYGFIQAGQNMKVRFDAFPYQHFGLFDGEISNTSKSIMLPNEIKMPIAIQEPMYRVEATLAEQEINAYGESMPLKAGMLLNADVVLERRSLLAWLFEPLLSL